MKRLAPAGEFAVDRGGEAVVLGEGQGPAADQRGAVLGQFLVPEGELRSVVALFAELLEQRIALCQDLAVFGQRLGVGRVGLGQRRIKVRAALGRRAFEDAQILRQEEHGVQPAGQVADAAAYAVEQHFAVQPGLHAGCAGREHETNLDALQPVGAAELSHQAGEGSGLLHRQEVDQLPVALRMRRAGARQVVDRLEQAGLALRVRSHDQRRAGRHLGLEPDEVADVGQG